MLPEKMKGLMEFACFRIINYIFDFNLIIIDTKIKVLRLTLKIHFDTRKSTMIDCMIRLKQTPGK